MESAVLVKAFGLLEAITAARAPVALAALASLTGTKKPTAHRVLKSLVTMGYVDRDASGSYAPGTRLGRIAPAGHDLSTALAAAAGPALRELHRLTGETVNLGLLRGANIVYLDVIESAHPLRRNARPDETDPALTTALGRAIVAHLPAEERARVLSTCALTRRTPKTVTDPRTLRRLLLGVHRSGYAVEQDQTDIGVTCVAAPIFGPPARSETVAAVSISAPTARLNQQTRAARIRAVRAAAERITAALAGHAHRPKHRRNTRARGDGKP